MISELVSNIVYSTRKYPEDWVAISEGRWSHSPSWQYLQFDRNILVYLDWNVPFSFIESMYMRIAFWKLYQCKLKGMNSRLEEKAKDNRLARKEADRVIAEAEEVRKRKVLAKAKTVFNYD